MRYTALDPENAKASLFSMARHSADDLENCFMQLELSNVSIMTRRMPTAAPASWQAWPPISWTLYAAMPVGNWAAHEFYEELNMLNSAGVKWQRVCVDDERLYLFRFTLSMF